MERIDVHSYLALAAGYPVVVDGEEVTLPEADQLSEKIMSLVLNVIESNQDQVSERDLKNLYVLHGNLKRLMGSTGLPARINDLCIEKLTLNLESLPLGLITKYLVPLLDQNSMLTDRLSHNNNNNTYDKINQFFKDYTYFLQGQITKEILVYFWNEIRKSSPQYERSPGTIAFGKLIEIVLKDANIHSSQFFMLAKTFFDTMMLNIKNFGIEDQAALIKIATFCAEQGDCIITWCIKNFGIEDQAALIKIATLYAEQEGYHTTCAIKNFGIENQAALIKIAMLCAEQDGRGTAENIENFHIWRRTALSRIAKRCAEQDGGGTAEYIKNFGINNPDDLISIAKCCAKQDGGGTAKYIQRFNIRNRNYTSNPAALIEIAKLCAQQNGGKTAFYIRNFNIRDQKALIEIAKLCAQQNGWETARLILNFCIDRTNDEREILLVAIEQNPKAIKFWKPLALPEEKNSRIFTLFGQPFNTEDVIAAIKFYIEKHLSRGDFTDLLERIINLKIETSTKRGLSEEEIQVMERELEQRKQQQLQWLGSALFLLRKKCDDDQIEWVKEQGFLDALSEMPRPDLRWLLTAALSRTASEPRVVEIWEELSAQNAGNTAQWYKLTQLLGCQLIVAGVEKETVLKLLNIINEDRIFLKDFKNYQVLIEALCRLAKEGNLTSEKKTVILERILMTKGDDITEEVLEQFKKLITDQPEGKKIEKTQIAECLQIIDVDDREKRKLCVRVLRLANDGSKELENKVSELREILKPTIVAAQKNREQLLKDLRCLNSILLFGTSQYIQDSNVELEKALEESLRRKVSMDTIVNFTGKYLATFGSSRDLTVLMTYAAKIASLGNTTVIRCLGRYITSVLKGTFTEVRNDPGRNNPHLEKIDGYNPTFLERWQQSDTISLGRIQSSGQEARFSAKKWLKQKMLTDNHLENFQNTCSFLYRYLQAKSDEDKKKIRGEFNKEMQETNKPSQDDSKYSNWIHLQVQNLCMQLITAKTSDDQMGKLKLLAEFLKEAPFNQPEFLNDVIGLQEELRKQKGQARQSKYVVVDTENYMDILLCGTEISGSCQRVDGNPVSTQGLLGYLLDGKNRLLAIKTEAGPQGRILARCLLRLLWDGEKPVLLRERLYPSPINSEYAKALNALAEKKAKALGVPLVSLDAKGEAYPGTLHALGGPVPFEYVDAARGMYSQGKFGVKGARLFPAA